MKEKIVKIGNLKKARKNLTVIGKVIEKNSFPTKNTPLNKARIEDETGKILLNLWGNKINQCKVGDYILIKKGFVRGRGYSGRELSTWSDIEVISKEKYIKMSSK